MSLHACLMSKRAEYMFALYSGSVAEPGDRNPYPEESLALFKLWARGYRRMMRVRIETGPAMQAYLRGRAARDGDVGTSFDVRPPWLD